MYDASGVGKILDGKSEPNKNLPADDGLFDDEDVVKSDESVGDCDVEADDNGIG